MHLASFFLIIILLHTNASCPSAQPSTVHRVETIRLRARHYLL